MTKTWILLNQDLTVFIFILSRGYSICFGYHLLTGKSDTKQNDGIHAVFFHLSIRPDEII